MHPSIPLKRTDWVHRRLGKFFISGGLQIFVLIPNQNQNSFWWGVYGSSRSSDMEPPGVWHWRKRFWKDCTTGFVAHSDCRIPAREVLAIATRLWQKNFSWPKNSNCIISGSARLESKNNPSFKNQMEILNDLEKWQKRQAKVKQVFVQKLPKKKKLTGRRLSTLTHVLSGPKSAPLLLLLDFQL